MRILTVLIFCSISMQFVIGRALAHTDTIGPLLIVEKVYGAPTPIGRIVVRYDATDGAKPKLRLRSNLFQAELPVKTLRNLPRPDWNNLSVPYSLTSFDVKTRRFVNRPYLFISVPLHGPVGKSWSSAHVLFFFDERGQLAERCLKQFVPVKGRRHRMDLPHAEADIIDTLYESWPLTSNDSAEAVLSRALARKQKSLSQ